MSLIGADNDNKKITRHLNLSRELTFHNLSAVLEYYAYDDTFFALLSLDILQTDYAFIRNFAYELPTMAIIYDPKQQKALQTISDMLRSELIPSLMNAGNTFRSNINERPHTNFNSHMAAVGQVAYKIIQELARIGLIKK